MICNKLRQLRLEIVKHFLLFAFLFTSFLTQAQVPVGDWRSHLPMSRFNWVGELPEKVFGANPFGLISYDREDGSIQDLTKINVLAQTGITCFECDYDNDLCIVGYENGNLDIIDGSNQVTNQPAIVSSNIVGDKAIKAIQFVGDVAYLATGIGLVELDLTSLNINEYAKLTYQGSLLELSGLMLLHDTFYLATQNNLFKASSATIFTEPLLDVTQAPFNPEKFKTFYTIGDQLHAIVTSEFNSVDSAFSYDGNSWSLAGDYSQKGVLGIESGDGVVLVAHFSEIVEYDQNFQRLRTIDSYGLSIMEAYHASYGRTEGEIIVADGRFGVVLTSFEYPSNSTVINISSPRTGITAELQEVDDVIYAMPGGSDFTFNQPYLFTFREERWSSRVMNLDTNTSIRNTSSIIEVGDFTYIGFDGSGLMQLDQEGNILQHFDESNAKIQDDPDGYYGLKGMAADDEDNLWMLNSRATSTLSILDPEGNWTLISLDGYPKPIADNFMRHSSGVFIFSLKDQGIILYDPGTTPTETSDDRFASINTSPANGNLPNNTVNCIVEDDDGEVWIGTDDGIGVIYSVESMFGPQPDDVQRIIVNQDGYNGYLFEGDAVMAIEVDGANRKWVAPRGAGLFLISSDGQEQITRFTEDDSPLLSDNVSDLAIHPETGELFIATEQGLQSFRSDATKPASVLQDLKVFPNPVKPGYNGVITVTGLTEGGYLRVTDVAGNLIYETRSQGGTAIWDGRDRTGAKVASGIYLFQAADRSGFGGAITKLMFLN